MKRAELEFLPKIVQAVTPAPIIETMRQFIKPRPLVDPASSAEANELVCADLYFDVEQDGLEQDWGGDFAMRPYVWMFPPLFKVGKRSSGASWVEKALGEYGSGRIFAALMFLSVSSSASWYNRLLNRYPTCFIGKRYPLRTDKEMQLASIMHDMSIIYVGPQNCWGDFAMVFTPLGAVTYPWYVGAE